MYMQLMSYAEHRKAVIKNGINAPRESGSSVYVFGNNADEYCIFNEVPSFSQLRVLLYVALIVAELTGAVAIPLLVATVYKKLQKKKGKKVSNALYFIYAAIITIGILLLAIFSFDCIAIHLVLTSNSFPETHTAFLALAVFLVIFPVIDLIAVICAVRKLCKPLRCQSPCGLANNHERRQLLSAQPEDEHSDTSGQNVSETASPTENEEPDNVRPNCTACIILFFSMMCVTLFTQLVLFNSVYLFMAIIAAPVETGSFLLLYAASLFCFVSFLAVVLKVLHQAGPHRTNLKWIGYCLSCVVLLAMLGAGVIVFIVFTYLYSKLNEEYRNDGGVMTFIGALLPSLAAAGVGGILMVVSRYVNEEKSNVGGIWRYVYNKGTETTEDNSPTGDEGDNHNIILDDGEPSIQSQNVTVEVSSP